MVPQVARFVSDDGAEMLGISPIEQPVREQDIPTLRQNARGGRIDHLSLGLPDQNVGDATTRRDP